MEKISVESLIYNHYIKYIRMTEMTNEAFVGSNANTVNVFIDMYSILKPLYMHTSNLSINNYTIITSSIINLCAHIREFFRTRYRVETKIFIIHSNNCSRSSTQFYASYNAHTASAIFNNAMITDMVNNNLELLKILCPYLYDIFFIQTQFEVGVCIYDILKRTKEYNKKDVSISAEDPSIIFSKDAYLYQLPALIDNVVIYRPRKKDGIDSSWFVNNANAIPMYVERRKSKYDYNSIIQSFNPSLLSLIMALTSFQEREIKSILNTASTIKIINEALINRQIYNGYNSDIRYVASILCTGKLANQAMLLENRFKSLDIPYQHSIYMSNAEATINPNSVINLYDPENVKLLNNKYFESNPLDLNRI